MSADSAVTYTSVHKVGSHDLEYSTEDPYEEAARQLFEQAPHSPVYIPENHIPVYIPEPEHPEDLVPAEDEAPTPPLPPFFLAPRIRPPYTRAAMRQMRAASPSTYHSLLPSGTPPLLPILYHLLAVIEQVAARSGMDSKMVELLSFKLDGCYTTPPTTTEAQAIIISVPDPSPIVLERISELEKKVKALSKVDHSEAIEESVQANVINEVKNQLPKLLPKLVSNFVNPRIERTIRELLQKAPTVLAQSSFTPGQSS
ncbi:hypothetical protein Tco_0857399 [Tanacetum coccineum]|uniref:Uncharacterized protein n=1 Tax=Tanacetum coccineum TaxID=301880 RepID=A0ABQ5B8V7_9ASTR